jgi:hypothetical protein
MFCFIMHGNFLNILYLPKVILECHKYNENITDRNSSHKK